MRRALLLLALLCGACVLPRRDAVLPPKGDTFIAVVSGRMPPAIDLVARHAWIVVQEANKPHRRYEYGGRDGPDPFDNFTGGDVAVHAVIPMSVAELQRTEKCLWEAHVAYHDRFPDYFPIPGPNSNTYVDFLLRWCALPAELPATCIGRDYRGLVGASVTSTRTGVQLESVVAGLKVGLVEGIEVHVLGLALGVHFWPPGLTLPVNPGRLGFTFDLSSERPHHADTEPEADEPPPRRFGSGSAWLRARGAVVANPPAAGGVVGLGTLGFGVRGLYGRRVGLTFGLDLDLGAAGPPGFVYAATLFPAGIGVTFGETGVLALRAGVGVFGVTSRVAPALSLPAELRLEVDVTRRARVGLVASATWNVGPVERRSGRLLGRFVDELALGVFVRFGRTRNCGRCDAMLGSGPFVGVERRELGGTEWWGVTAGVESDVVQ